MDIYIFQDEFNRIFSYIKELKEVSIKMIVLGIGIIGMLKSVIEMAEKYFLGDQY